MKLYVGTYKKYNEGSIDGAWLDLEDYADLEDFYEACYELHKDEEDPELMFQDSDGVPEFLYSESAPLHKDIYEFVNLDDDDKEMVEAYIENVGLNGDLEGLIGEALEAYQGQWSSFNEFAREFAEETLDIPGRLQGYIDYDAFASDLEHDYFESNGHVFRNI